MTPADVLAALLDELREALVRYVILPSAEAYDAVTWPEGWPLRYTTYPDWAADAAPSLYFLHYRSPAPFDPYTVHDYLVPARPDLRVWNHSAIKLNHVVHHGAVGHEA